MITRRYPCCLRHYLPTKAAGGLGIKTSTKWNQAVMAKDLWSLEKPFVNEVD